MLLDSDKNKKHNLNSNHNSKDIGYCSTNWNQQDISLCGKHRKNSALMTILMQDIPL